MKRSDRHLLTRLFSPCTRNQITIRISFYLASQWVQEAASIKYQIMPGHSFIHSAGAGLVQLGLWREVQAHKGIYLLLALYREDPAPCREDPAPCREILAPCREDPTPRREVPAGHRGRGPGSAQGGPSSAQGGPLSAQGGPGSAQGGPSSSSLSLDNAQESTVTLYLTEPGFFFLFVIFS